MTREINCRIEGAAGRITLERPQALNALTYDMLRAIEAALDTWRDDPCVKLVIIDAAGEKAFAAGGDIRDLYETGKTGDFAYGQKFWADEYRLNAKIAEYPKPYIAFMQGFTMGGGVGVSCHGSHRIVCENTQIAMPECGIGLVPDVGGSLLLARGPGSLGEYLGLTSARMGPADAIYASFADHFVPYADWDALRGKLVSTGDASQIEAFSSVPSGGSLQSQQAQIDAAFNPPSLADIVNHLEATPSDFATNALKSLSRNSPLSLSVALDVIASARCSQNIRDTLREEYRYVYRCMEHGDFLEGIRAAIIDKDRNPNWPHTLKDVPKAAITKMRDHLGDNELTF